MRQPPIIIGAGPAGCAAAITLARAGHPPIVLERASAPTDKVCGDFLSADAIRRATDLGADPRAVNAEPIHRMRLVHRGRHVETPLPFAAVGLSRRRFDAALLHAAQQAGAVVRLGQTVRHLAREGALWSVQASGAPPLLAETVLLAAGKHDLRDMPRPNRNQGAVGFKMYYRPALQRHLAGTIELTLFPGGYAGVQPVENGRLNLCLAVRPDVAREHGWDGLLRNLAENNPATFSLLAESISLLPRPLAIANVPYGYLACRTPAAGLFRLGDQAAVIPSLTGDGVAIALYSGASAAEAWLRGDTADRWQRTLAGRLRSQMSLAGMLHRFAFATIGQATATRMIATLPGLLRLFASRTRLPGQPLD